jgi:hypothetical protein
VAILFQPLLLPDSGSPLTLETKQFGELSSTELNISSIRGASNDSQAQDVSDNV